MVFLILSTLSIISCSILIYSLTLVAPCLARIGIGDLICTSATIPTIPTTLLSDESLLNVREYLLTVTDSPRATDRCSRLSLENVQLYTYVHLLKIREREVNPHIQLSCGPDCEA